MFGYAQEDFPPGPLTQIASSVAQNVGGLILLAPYTSIRDMVGELAKTRGLGVAGKFAGYLISNRSGHLLAHCVRCVAQSLSQ